MNLYYYLFSKVRFFSFAVSFFIISALNFSSSISLAQDSLNQTTLTKQQQERAQKLFLQVKCLICEGQVIESSDTQIAIEMRKLITEKFIKDMEMVKLNPI